MLLMGLLSVLMTSNQFFINVLNFSISNSPAKGIAGIQTPTWRTEY